MTGNDKSVLDGISKQLETVKNEYNAARCNLDEVVELLVTDVKQNLHNYVFDNIRRETWKRPEQLEILDEETLQRLRDELREPIETNTERIVAELRNFKGWYDVDTTYVDVDSSPWKSVKSIEDSVNRVLKGYGLSAINMKNWTWLSMELDHLASEHFTSAKMEFIEKHKQFRYFEARYKEEAYLSCITERMTDI